MNLRDLEYLVAISEFRHFRKAAEYCFVSQPTLSGQLKKLEKHLGVQLVERTKHKVLMTPAGLEIVRRAKLILQSAQEIESFANHSSDPMKGPLKLGLIPTVAPHLLPIILRPIQKKFPELELLISEIQTEVMVRELLNGDIELGILALPIGEAELKETPLYQESFLLALPPQHTLEKKHQLKLEDLKSTPLLLLEEGHCLRDQALEVCQMAGTLEQESFKATSLETLKQMVKAGLGLTLIPKLSSNFQDKDIVYKAFKNPPTRSIGLLYRHTSARKDCYEKIGELILEVIEEMIHD